MNILLPILLSCTLLASHDNETYLVETEGTKQILRVYRQGKFWLTEEDNYLFEIEWLNFIKNYVSVSYPISDLQRLVDGRYAVLFSFAEGTDSLTESQAELFGRSIAQIHLASNFFQSTRRRHQTDLIFLLDDSLQRFNQFLRESYPEDRLFLTEKAAELREAIERIGLSGDEWGVIGGDFHGYNHHVDENNCITHFDFDLVSYGWRVYDLAVFKGSRGEDPVLWQACLKGYEALRPLSERELEALPLFIQIRNFWLCSVYTTFPEVQGRWDELRLLLIGENVTGLAGENLADRL